MMISPAVSNGKYLVTVKIMNSDKRTVSRLEPEMSGYT
jgi:hypothetical protein